MTTAPRFVSHGLTHVGLVRQRNEDAFIERPEHGIWAVADGMGGHEQGDYASAAVVNRLAAFKPFADLEEFTDEVRRALAHVDVHLRALRRSGDEFAGEKFRALGRSRYRRTAGAGAGAAE